MCRHATLLGLSGLALAIFLSGCGGDNPLGRKAVAGAVTLDGKPLENGVIEFDPMAGGVQSGGLISAGRYSIPTRDGPTIGKYKVVIIDSPKTPPPPPGHMPGDDLPPQPKPQVPAEWNSKSQQTIEIQSAGPFVFNFDIKTKSP